MQSAVGNNKKRELSPNSIFPWRQYRNKCFIEIKLGKPCLKVCENNVVRVAHFRTLDSPMSSPMLSPLSSPVSSPMLSPMSSPGLSPLSLSLSSPESSLDSVG